MNDKKSKKGIIGITLAAIIIASLFAVLPLSVLSNPDDCEEQPGALTVSIERPVNGTSITKCTEFYVNAVVANTGTGNFMNVNATINITGAAELVPTGSGGAKADTKYVGDFSSHTVKDVWWKLHCNGTGPVTINVTVNSTTPGLNVSSYEVIVIQKEAPVTPVLWVDIFQWPTEIVDNCTIFGVKANITYNGTGTISGVTANITWDPEPLANLHPPGLMPDNWTLPDMEAGDLHEVGWTMHCNGAGDVNITVYTTYNGMEPGKVHNETVTVQQREPANITVNITTPVNNSEICTNCTNTFNLTALVSNIGDDATGSLNARINATAGDTSVKIDGVEAIYGPFTKTIPSIPGNEFTLVNWSIECTDIGDVTFEVFVEKFDHTINDTDTVTISQKQFTIDVLYPKNDSTVSSCQVFNVSARLQNCLNREVYGKYNVTIDLNDIAANLTGTPPKVYVEHKPKDDWPDEATMTYVGDGKWNVTFSQSFCPCCYADLNWSVECLNTTDGNITVTVDPVDEATVALDNDTVYVNQEWKADLAGGIWFHPGTIGGSDFVLEPAIPENQPELAMGQNFSVVIPVINWGEADAKDVSVTIGVINKTGSAHLINASEPLTRNLGTIAGNGSKKAIWDFHCDGEGTVEFGITSLTGIDENTGVQVLPGNVFIPCNKTLMQIPFKVEIVEPETCNDFLIGQEFTVKAKITNNGTTDIDGINATLSWTGNAKIRDDQPNPIYVGTLKPGKYAKVTWQMNCSGTGDVKLDVIVNSTDPKYTIYSDTVTVHQKKRADVTVEILSPDDECTFIATSTEFMVTATIKDEVGCLNATVTYVELIIEPEDSASVVSGNQYIGPFALNTTDGVKTLNWTLHCDKSKNLNPCDPNKITVDVYGTDSAGKDFYASQHTHVYQYPAAHPEVEISTPGDGSRKALGSEFNVTATIKNTGEADVWEGKAILSVDPAGSLRVAEGGYTQEIGALVGHGQDGSKTVTWKVQCEELGKSTITVDVSGKDEFGYHLKQCDGDDNCPCSEPPYCLVCTYEPAMEPGRAIPEDHIEPKSITVKQVTEEDIVEPFDNNITIVGANWTFMSVPKKLVPAQETFGGLLDTTLLVVAYKYDPTTPPYWIPLTGSDPVEVLEGYWIYYSSEDTITLSYLTKGQMVPPSKDLTGKKWNAIGFSSTSAKSARTTLKSVEGSWSTVIGWDETGQRYESAIIYEVNDEELMYPGKGYWDWMTANNTLSALSA